MAHHFWSEALYGHIAEQGNGFKTRSTLKLMYKCKCATSSSAKTNKLLLADQVDHLRQRMPNEYFVCELRRKYNFLIKAVHKQVRDLQCMCVLLSIECHLCRSINLHRSVKAAHSNIKSRLLPRMPASLGIKQLELSVVPKMVSEPCMCEDYA